MRLFDCLSEHALRVLGCGIVATSALFIGLAAHEYELNAAEFERRAANPISAVRGGLEDAVEVLEGVNRLFATSDAVSREQFSAFTRPLLEQHPYIWSVNFHRVVPHAGRAAFEAEMRKRYPDFHITEVANGRVVPAAMRERYRVIDYIEPMSGNEAALGLDASSRQEQAVPAQRACATGKAFASGLHPLLHGSALQHATKRGFVIVMPVYRPGSPAPGCDAVTGYTAAVLGAGELVERALQMRRLLDGGRFDMSVYAGSAADDASLMFRIGAAPRAVGRMPDLYKWLVKDRPDPVAETFEVAGRSWHIVVSPVDAPFLARHVSSLLALAAGALLTLLAAAYMQALASRSRRIQHVVDLRTAELVEANQSLQLREQAIESCINAIIIISAEGPDYPIEYVNPAFERITGYGAAEVNGRSVRLLWRNDLDQDGIRAIRAMVREQREVSAVHRSYRKDGSMFWSEVAVAPVRDAAGTTHHFVIAHNDVTETKRYEAELEYQATHDALTGLANRNLLDTRLREAIDDAARRQRTVWVMFVDIDRFKFVNDSLGHRAGDTIIKAAAQRLLGAVREGDTVARFGGDEFVLVLPEREEELLSDVVQRVMAGICEPLAIDGHALYMSCSAGIAAYPADAVDADTLIEHADLAMYRAKELGRNTYQFYTATLNERAQERLQIESALHSALERGEFALHYQPQVDLCSGRIVGIEALLRWHHPELGMVPPVRFIDLAEETGLIIPIGAWALREACRQGSEWRRKGLGELRVAVNLSARQFSQQGLAARIAAVLAETGFEAGLLDVELTESLVMNDVDGAVRVLNELRALGVALSIDDFGTGYSSLSYLRRFPIDMLKIDRSFVREISEHTNNAAIPDAIISMAHSLGIKVIAEGVETEAQCEYLSRNMCDEIQGFLFSRPLPAPELEALLVEARVLPGHLLRMHKRDRTLLLVDDEPNILSALRRLLRSSGYRILTAASGPQGLELLEKNEVDVIVSDQRMPGMTGVEFLRTVKTLYPDIVRIVLSGFTELQSVTDAVNEGAIYKFLTKPWDDAQLRGHMEEAFRHKEMADENRRLSLEVRTANHNLAKANRQLEAVLQQKEQQINRDEVALDVVRETLRYVPLPIVGLDEEGVVAFANEAAQALFRESGFLLGGKAEQLLPQVWDALQGVAPGFACAVSVHDRRYTVVSRSMGNGTQSRGSLITLVPEELA